MSLSSFFSPNLAATTTNAGKDIVKGLEWRSSPTSLSQRPTKDQNVDAVILTALNSPEKTEVLSHFTGDHIGDEFHDGVIYKVVEARIGDRSVRIAVACQNKMGMTSAAILTCKAIKTWNPRYVVMCGICAGIAAQGVNLGDIIVAQDVFDYGSGKIEEQMLHPDYNPITTDSAVCNLLVEFSGRTEILSKIRDSWQHKTGKPKTELQAHVGAFASGAAVVADEKVVQGIVEHKRSLLGIDMEAYGVAQAVQEIGDRRVRHIICKAVCDYANAEKSDDFQEYCAFVSAAFVKEFFGLHAPSLFGF